MRLQQFFFSLGLLLIISFSLQAEERVRRDYPIIPVPFTSVSIDSGMWSSRCKINRMVTIPFAFRKCEETGRIDNFAKAGGLVKGEFKGLRFNDSDVFKLIEGASYSLSIYPDPALEKYLDDLIAKISAAQEKDGYLYTARTLSPHTQRGTGETRWSNLKSSHELYNVGHMYEAAVAHWQATGKKTLLNVAIKNADLLTTIFGTGMRNDVPGHQEIEIGLVKLYRVTGTADYLHLARFLLDQRGQSSSRKLYGSYCQDHLPVIDQNEAVGHAVRAVYMYSGMADIAAITGDDSYVQAIDAIWDNVASRKLYLTGGIGARHKGESFGKNYELPNETGYGETCAAIGNAQWNHRMFLLHGDAKYIDVLERVIYNGFLAGISLEGESFFYCNPLASDGDYKFNKGSLSRQSWFGCSCCPVNIVRFMPSIAGYVYGQVDESIFVNLFTSGSSNIQLKDQVITLTQRTNYPWDGSVELTVSPEQPESFAIKLRVPGWAQEQPLPGGLYRFAKPSNAKVSLTVNGTPIELNILKGYATINRKWKKGDIVQFDIPMPVRRVLCTQQVQANTNRVAIQRGPLVYCLEAVDNTHQVSNLALLDDVKLTTKHQSNLLGGIITIHGKALASSQDSDNEANGITPVKFTAIPYYAWNHRKTGEMAVWLQRSK